MHKMSKKVVQLTQIVQHQNDQIEDMEMALAQRPAEEARLHAFVQDFLANYRNEMEQRERTVLAAARDEIERTKAFFRERLAAAEANAEAQFQQELDEMTQLLLDQVLLARIMLL